MTEASSFLARPTRAQYDWADMELGLFIHWFPQTHDDPMDRRTDNITDPAVQREMMSHARLERFSARQWVQSALDLGAKYIVFVAKHGCGICRWQSQYGEMNFKNAPYKDGRGMSQGGDPAGHLHLRKLRHLRRGAGRPDRRSRTAGGLYEDLQGLAQRGAGQLRRHCRGLVRRLH